MPQLQTPYHYLLPRRTYDLLRAERPALLADSRLLWVEDRLHGLGPDSPVRLFFRSAADKREYQLQLIYEAPTLPGYYTTDHQPTPTTA